MGRSISQLRWILLSISKWRLLFTLVVVGVAVYSIMNNPVRLGLDLQGGTQVVLEAQDTPEVEVDAEVTAGAMEVLRRRVDALGVAEPTLQVSGENRIIIELPGMDDPDRAVEVIGQTAQLTFHHVLDSYPEGTVPDDVEALVIAGNPGEELALGPVAVSGEQVESANPFFDTQGTVQWVVSLQFFPQGEQAWAELTAEAACAGPADPARRIAIVLDSTVISSPGVNPSVPCGLGITGGGTIITGAFTQEEATELAALIQAGALPVPVEVIERGTIGPTLGQQAIEASVEAALIGASLTILYMIAFYRLMGVVAAISLVAYALIALAALTGIGATLTLPGIAGFVLAIGMAVDANVLVYERAKEEYATGIGFSEAVVTGFSKAWSAIIDSNITTLLAAFLLFAYASGAVRGFGVTLSIGVLVSLFSALVVTRFLLEVFGRVFRVDDRPQLAGMSVGQRYREWVATAKPDLLGSWGRWLKITALVTVLAISGLFVAGVNLGLEFVGGRLFEFTTERSVDLDAMRSDLAEGGLPQARVQESGEGNLIIRTEQLDEQQEAFVVSTASAAGGQVTVVRDQFIGPSLGAELRNRALVALSIAVVVQLAYLAIRFRWTYALSSVVSTIHDVAVLIGLFAWMGKTFDGVFLAALLTVIGYSVNDSVVIFDRVRERRALRPDDPMVEVANEACLQTFPRTLNTGMGALLILVSLFVLGGDTLGDFALALIIGLLVGSYSSIFAAAPMAIALETRFPPPPPEPEPTAPRSRRSTTQP